jgi:hypothetical protein
LRRLVRKRRKRERYTPLDLCSNIDLFIIDDDTIIVREEVDLEDGKI